MTLEFEKAWSDLNHRLQELEQDGGLITALAALEDHHQESGFIRNTVHDLERYVVPSPDDPARFFRIQYNPRRAQRFAGSGKKPNGSALLNNGCFLCRDNIRVQQQGIQLGYQIDCDGRGYMALTNPFPLLPEHIVIAANSHRTQEWALHGEDGVPIGELVGDIVQLAARLPGHVGFYNGVGAGASIPGHLHFQFFKRPRGEQGFPLEMAGHGFDGETGEPGLIPDYPLNAAKWTGTADDVIARVSGWITAWGGRNAARIRTLTANIIATRLHDGRICLYFVPRDRERARPEAVSGLVGGLEVLGEIVLSSEEDWGRYKSGEISYEVLEGVLKGARTELEPA